MLSADVLVVPKVPALPVVEAPWEVLRWVRGWVADVEEVLPEVFRGDVTPPPVPGWGCVADVRHVCLLPALVG